MGVERFCTRRGIRSVIWSNNGTNFVASEKTFVEYQKLEPASPRRNTRKERHKVEV